MLNMISGGISFTIGCQSWMIMNSNKNLSSQYNITAIWITHEGYSFNAPSSEKIMFPLRPSMRYINLFGWLYYHCYITNVGAGSYAIFPFCFLLQACVSSEWGISTRKFITVSNWKRISKICWDYHIIIVILLILCCPVLSYHHHNHISDKNNV